MKKLMKISEGDSTARATQGSALWLAARPRRIFVVVLLATLLLQTAWILAMPAFRGIDEFDHVYKADAVAHGQLLDDGPAAEGRGGLVRVRRPVVEDAAATCSWYKYTGPDNCRVVEDLGSGMVTVASAASRYNPVYYAVVGTLAKPLNGAANLFALRAFSALFAALLIAWAAVATAQWARTAWPLLALLVAATPVLVYSTTLAAPNGVGYAAGLLLWATSLGMVAGQGRPQTLALVTGALTVMVTHSLGVVWVLVVAVVILTLQPLREWRELLLRWPGRLGGAAALVVCGALACSAWIVLAKPNVRTAGPDEGGRLGAAELIWGQVVWVLQTIAAFPTRTEQAPSLVYFLWLALFVSLVAMGCKRASRRVWVSAALLLLVWIAFPVALSFWSYGSEGLAWQGRYALPLAVGFPALAGLALDQSRLSPRRTVIAGAVFLAGVAQVVSVISVAILEADKGLAPTFAAGNPARIAFIAALATVGALAPLLLIPRGSADPAALSGTAPK